MRIPHYREASSEAKSRALDLKIGEYPCSSLADAIIFAETSFASQLQVTIPSLEEALDPQFSVLSLGKLLEMDEWLPKNTTAAGPAGHALCAEDGTGQDGEVDGDEGRGGDDKGV